MNNTTTNSSAPASPIGTTSKVAYSASSNNHNTNKSNAGGEQAHQNTDYQQKPAKLARSGSLCDISPRESPGEPQLRQAEFVGSAPESLKVKIKTNSFTNTIVATTTANDTNNNSNNNTNSSVVNNKLANEKPNTDSKTAVTSADISKPTGLGGSSNSRSGSRKGKQNNGDTSSATSSNSSFNSTTSSDLSATSITMSATKSQSVINNHDGGSSLAENGRKSTLPNTTPQLSSQPPQIQPIPPPAQTIQLQIQSQQPPLPIPQPQVPTQPPPTLAPTRLPSVPATAPTSAPIAPKPKATRAKKQTAANNKNAITTNAIAPPPKPEAKTRTKKAKQNAETKAAATASSAATTTQASSQQLQPISSAAIATAPAAPSSASDKKVAENQRQGPTTPAKKRKPRAPPATEATAQPTNPPKRTRKKKTDQAATAKDSNNNPPPLISTNMTLPPLSVNPQLLSVASSVPMGSSPLMSNAQQQQPYPSMQPLNINRNIPGMSPLDVHDPNQRYVSVSLSPYANHDYTNSLARQHSLSKLLFTSSSSSAIHANPHSDEIVKAFEELRDHSWSHLSKCILEPAQQFDIPSLIGTLYELRADNERQLKRVKELTLQREQLAAMNAKLDMTGPMMLQNLNQTSPGFASVVAGLQNSPKSLQNSSPSPAMNKSPIVSGGAYHVPPPGSSLGPPGILYDRSSPMVGIQTQHSGVNSLKSSMISTPSPPTSAFMAHGANNRAGLMTVNNSPYMSNIHNALNPHPGPASSYYPRQ